MISFNLEKTQIELSVKVQIEDKMDKNKIEYQRHQRNELKKESIQLKSKDQTKNISLYALK